MASKLLFGMMASLLTAPSASVLAEPVLAPLFRDHLVLQREKPVPIWGKASPGEEVSVSFQGQTKETTADPRGNWKIILDPLRVSSSPEILLVRGRGSARRVQDVLVGDVWLCSGQSNMGWKVSRANDYAAEAAKAGLPAIRCFEIAKSVSATPADSLRAVWIVSSSRTFGRFSAVAYYFARDLHREIDVPIGLITSSWGGTEIEPWISLDALRADPAYPEIEKRDHARMAGVPALMKAYRTKLDRYAASKAEAEAQGGEVKTPPPREPEGEVSRKTPSALFNAMIHPLLPNAIKGILWYQGESNAGRDEEYRTLFATLIRQWRRDFSQGDLPFYFVQLAAWNRVGGNRVVAGLREAQLEALNLPNTAVAVTIDIGDPDTVHPLNKREVGRRLALNALAQTYGKAVAFSGPLFREAKVEGAKMRVRFDYANGLRIKEGMPNGFEVAGDDHRFHPADAAVEGMEVLVSAKAVPAPVAVRYAFVNYPSASLYNGAELPAAPFRSDRWPLEEAAGPAPTAAKE